ITLAVLAISAVLMSWSVGVPSAAAPAPTPTIVPIAVLYTLPLSTDITYTVQPRDTLDQIAAAFDVRLACLRETNGLRPADILVFGQPLDINLECPAYDGILPVNAPRQDAPGRTGEDGTYVARPNDTLDTIGQRLNISAQALAQANDIEFGRTLNIGDLLVIPDDAPEYGVFPATEDETLSARLDRAGGEDAQTYIVQPNDTLDVIGQQLDVSVIDLLQYNDIAAGRDLRIGFTLVIPPDAAPYGEFPVLLSQINTDTRERVADGDISGEEYVIQPNDTLDVIGQEFNVSVVALRQANAIDSIRDVVPGRLIIIPDDAPAYGVFPAIGESAGEVVANGQEYVIQPGDTLDGIAAQFNVDTRCVIDANSVRFVRLIQPGQTVGIPTDCPPYSGYDVVPSAP
ncbi:MAG: LysM peptidoglycan-binding domain-containing protein, partial [Armatimonadetes bacterium]|nr:LysM peptidoglycan-binding domain-containing protein [Anaerolineae bacterium]